jgi:hypothetical protein
MHKTFTSANNDFIFQIKASVPSPHHSEMQLMSVLLGLFVCN